MDNTLVPKFRKMRGRMSGALEPAGDGSPPRRGRSS